MKAIKSFAIPVMAFIAIIFGLMLLDINAQNKVEVIPTQQELLNRDSLLLWSELSLYGDTIACYKLYQTNEFWYEQEEYWATTDPLFYDQMTMVYENLDCHCGWRIEYWDTDWR
jgi:uncharacterized membrane protein YcgQ (UPF0703/DUF1980 family)